MSSISGSSLSITGSTTLNGLSVGSMLLTTKAILLPKQVKESPFQMDY
jgi:hypothetical protein